MKKTIESKLHFLQRTLYKILACIILSPLVYICTLLLATNLKLWKINATSTSLGNLKKPLKYETLNLNIWVVEHKYTYEVCEWTKSPWHSMILVLVVLVFLGFKDLCIDFMNVMMPQNIGHWLNKDVNIVVERIFCKF